MIRIYFYEDIPDVKDKAKALNLLVLMMPVEHRHTFRMLVHFFLEVIKNEEHNRMGLRNVAMITAPSFFPQRLLTNAKYVFGFYVYFFNKRYYQCLFCRDPNNLEKQVKDAAISYEVMELLLRMGDNMWWVPKDLARQALEAQQRAQDRRESNKDKRTVRCFKFCFTWCCIVNG